MTDIKVSYLMTSYNHKKYIKKAIDSILNSSHKNIELIVCDDCSTDGSDVFLEEYSKEKNFIFLKNEVNKGACYTVDRLIKEASGEYLGLLASDDWIKRDKIELQLSYMLENNLDAVFSPLVTYMEATDTYVSEKSVDVSWLQSTPTILKHFYETGQGAGLLQSALFKTRCVQDIGMLTEYKVEDAIFQMRFLQAGYKVGYLNVPLTYYRIHSYNTHHDALKILYEYELPFIRDFFPVQYQKNVLALAYADAACKLANEMRIFNALQMQMKALKYKCSWKIISDSLKVDIRYLLRLTGLYKYYWRIVHRREWPGR